MKAPLEIERKYLIHMPNVAALEDMQGVRVFHITQTYLCAPAGITRRVRRRTEGDKTVYILTEKERVSSLTAVERERELTEAEYEAALATARPDATPIEKTRYAIPYGNYTVEIDVYPFWSDAAILEIELGSEEECVELPPYVALIAEVTADARFKNAALAKSADTRGDLPRLLAPDMR